MQFQDFAGNFALKKHLGGQAAAGRLFHAYILVGPPGSGKHTLARILAAALVCGEEDRPCLQCAHCRKTFDDIHPDVIRAGRDGTLLVGQARALRADAYIRPNEAARKVYILEDAQEMSDRAQDVLLKLLEEGPPYAAFLLLTDNLSALLPTVRSRCELLTLSPVRPDEAEDYLKNRFSEKPLSEVRVATAACGGLLGAAVSRLMQGETGENPACARARDFVRRLSARRELELAAFAAGLEKCTREEFTSFLDEAVSLLRERLLRMAVASGEPEDAEDETLSKRAALEVISVLRTLRDQCEWNVGVGHLAGLLAASCWEAV